MDFKRLPLVRKAHTPSALLRQRIKIFKNVFFRKAATAKKSRGGSATAAKVFSLTLSSLPRRHSVRSVNYFRCTSYSFHVPLQYCKCSIKKKKKEKIEGYVTFILVLLRISLIRKYYIYIYYIYIYIYFFYILKFPEVHAFTWILVRAEYILYIYILVLCISLHFSFVNIVST